MNNKGFSLIEILVTVGLIGILVSVAVPSYRNYKRNTIKMAMKAEVGNGQKAYGAKYAVDSSYCYNLAEVGMDTDRSTSPIFVNKGFFGFGAGISTGDICDADPLANYQFISPGDGSCSDASYTSASDCTTNSETWTPKANTAGANAPACTLGTNTFLIGAYSDVSSLDTIVQANHEGKVEEHGGEKNCQ
ncbi:MAG: prepilin-type N-terminal cleavage/methylation domain-containing protein [Bdellovibrionales bacterium]|nr:prepilin-type N-terminal cleavage/methylation domain-containing protein [Bdellovibrionales bacterium]